MLIRPERITIFFVASDVITFFVQVCLMPLVLDMDDCSLFFRAIRLQVEVSLLLVMRPRENLAPEYVFKPSFFRRYINVLVI